jgi:hypothetical protein
MAKKDIWIILAVLAVVGLLFYFKPFGTNIFAVTGSETVTRSVPTQLEKGATGTLSYTAGGVSGSWGATVLDAVSGGCTITVSSLQKTSLQFAMLSDLPNPLTYTVTAPSATGTCTFTGDYKFGNYSVKPLMGSSSISIICTPVWSYSAWSTCAPACSWTGKDPCLASFTDSSTQTRTATDSKNCGTTTGRDILSQSCSATCSRTITKSLIAPNADTDCSGVVDRTEVGVAITAWVGSTLSRDEVGLAIQAWSQGG